MPETDYPQPFKHEDFGTIKPVVKPKPASSVPPKQNVSGGSTATVVRPVETTLVGVTDIAFFVGGKISPSYNNGVNSDKDSYPAPDINKQLNFAPGLDKTIVAWKLTTPDKISKVTFELTCKSRNKPGYTAIATTTWDNKTLGTANAVPSKDWSGGAALQDLFKIPKNFKLDDDTDAFPDGCLTATHSPYQIKMTITPDVSAVSSAFPLTAWTYIQVLVHSIEVRVGKPEMLVQERPDITDLVNKTRILTAEPAIINKLPSTQALDPKATYEIELDSNVFRNGTNRDVVENDTDFQSYKNLWGNGPRIPLLAKVLIRQADGSPADLPQALGHTKLLWDWEDKTAPKAPERWRASLPNGVSKETTHFLETLFKPVKIPILPEGSNNCPSTYGGKYGQTGSPVFPPQAATNIFPYRVESATNRDWAAFSTFGTGDKAATSGVIFQPSRMAGDKYTINVYLDINRQSNLNTAKPVVANSALTGSAGSFLILRKLRLSYLVRGATKLGVNPQDITTYLQDIFRKELFVKLDINQAAIDNTTYRQATANAVEVLCQNPVEHNDIRYLPLVARNAVITAPDDNTPGVVLRDKTDFLNTVEAVFRNGAIRQMDLTQTNPLVTTQVANEELVGGTTRVHGLFLSSAAPVNNQLPKSLILFYDSAHLFNDTETLRGYTSGKTYSTAMSTKHSCWGHQFTRVYSTEGKYANGAIDVIFPNAGTITLNYAPNGWKRTRAVEPSENARLVLRNTLNGLSQFLDESQPVRIQLKGNKNLENSFTRFNLLEAYLQELFEEGLIIDRRAIWEALSSYGHEYKVVAKTAQAENGLYEQSIVLTFPDEQKYEIRYEKTLSLTLKTELSDDALDALKQRIVGKLDALPTDEQQIFSITISARTNTANAQKRLENLQTYLDLIFNDYAFTTNRAVWQQKRANRLAPDWQLLQPADFKRIWQKTIPIDNILPQVIKEYSALALSNEEGIVVLHLPGRTNLPALPIAGAGYNDLKVTGNFHPTVATSSQLAVVAMATVDANTVRTDATLAKPAPAAFAHELGRALFLANSIRFVPGEVITPEYSLAAHLSTDSCLMDYSSDAVHFCGICMLRVRGWSWRQISNKIPNLEYRLTLELDTPSIIFEHPANHDEGLKARLQALGLFTRPLNHPESDDCLRFSREHLKELFPETENLSANDLEDFFNKEIKQFLVEKGSLPAKGDFVKIRVPGNYYVMYSQVMQSLIKKTLGLDTAAMQAYGQYSLNADRYKVEQSFYEDNPALGKIPLKVKVEVRPKDNNNLSFCPMAGTKVYFELMRPEKLPNYVEDNNLEASKHLVAGGYSFYKQPVAPTLRTSQGPVKPNGPIGAVGPSEYIKGRVLGYDPSIPEDPQANNAHAHLGGKRKLGNVSQPVQLAEGIVRQNIFSTPINHGVFIDPPPIKGRFANAAAVETDSTGVARMIFMPSRTGGDCYRLRACLVDPGNMTDPVIASTETGTMVRWRTVRLSRHLQMPVPRTLDELPLDLQTLAAKECDHSTSKGKACLYCQMRTQPPAPLTAICKHRTPIGQICDNCFLESVQLPNVDFKGTITREFAKAYCEFIIERPALSPENISDFGPEIIEGALALQYRYPKINSTRFVGSKPAIEQLVVDNNNPRLFRASLTAAEFEPFSISINFIKNPAEDRVGNNVQTYLTLTTTQLVDTAKVDGGVAGTLDYERGILNVIFNQPQKDTIEYEAYYEPGGRIDLTRRSSTEFTASDLSAPVDPYTLLIQPKQAGRTVAVPTEAILIDQKQAAQFTDTGKIDGTVSGKLNYQTGELTVTFSKAQTNIDYEVYYEPGTRADLVRSSDKTFKVTLTTPVTPYTVTVQPKVVNQTTVNLATTVLTDGVRSFNLTSSSPQDIQGTIDYNNRTVTMTLASDPAPNSCFELWYHSYNFIDIQRLAYFPERSPYMFNLYLPPSYNERIAAGTFAMQTNPSYKPGYFKPPSAFEFINSDWGVILNWLFQSVTYGLNGSRGFYPGILFVQANYTSVYSGLWGTKNQEGKGPGNIVFVFGNNLTIGKKNPFTTLALHELSHTLYMLHAPFAPNFVSALHDTTDSVRCLMSYDPNQGDFCGQCLAVLRGLNALDLRLQTQSGETKTPDGSLNYPITG